MEWFGTEGKTATTITKNDKTGILFLPYSKLIIKTAETASKQNSKVKK